MEMTMGALYLGLDVHKKTISIATAEEGRLGEVRSHGTIENTPLNIEKLMKRFSKVSQELHFCYEAGCCGYVLQRQITSAGHSCTVVAPNRIPRKPGEFIKTDRRDAIKLARLHRAGELDEIWVPDAAHEAMRDIIRSHGDAKNHLKTCKQQLHSFLLRHGRIFTGLCNWTRSHYTWLANQKFEHPAHQVVFQDYINAIHDAEDRERKLVKQIEELLPQWTLKPVVDALCLLKGINLVAAATILSVTGDLRRFPTPKQLSAYFGQVPSEHSSGEHVKRFGLTKAGNSEARRILTQGAWCYRFPARISKQKEPALVKADKAIRDVAWRAQLRLCSRYRRLIALGKPSPVACSAVARELATFIWEIGQVVPLQT
jgi:transposase